MTELYVMQRYLQNSKLQNMGLGLFDSWASTFGEVVTSIELAPEGTGYRAKSRFARFYNIPELMNMFKEIADIKTSDQLKLPVPEAEYETVVLKPTEQQKEIVFYNIPELMNMFKEIADIKTSDQLKLPVPEAEYETVVLKPTEQQKEIVESLGERAEVVRNGGVDAAVDNMLKITNDGRKLALDQRLVNELLPDNPESKISVCAEKSYEIWKDTAAQKSAQLIFCDLSTPKGDGSFNVYDDLKQKLIEKGVPEKEIAFIHDANTEAKKTELFGKVKSGQVRFLIGSTAKMGAGTNVQKLPVPEAEYETVVLKPTEQQKEIVESLGERAEVVRNGGVDASVDNMLKITNDGRKLALDQRLVNELLPDNPESKISVCAEKSYEIWKDTAAQKSAQLIFCDLSTPKGDGSFNVYDDLKQKLIEKGVPEKEIAFIHDANTEAKKTELFGKVKSGQVRFLIGSTAKMGAGTNVQDRLIALHHLDIGWKPSDVGRILRTFKIKKNVEVTDNGKIII